MQFSIQRLWLLVRKQWGENKQLYTLGLLAYAGIIAAIIIYNLTEFEGLNERVQGNIIFMGLIGGGFAFTTTILGPLNQKLTGISTLMLPASALEKLAMAAIYSMIIFPFCFIAVLYPLLALGVYIDHHLIGRPNSLYLVKGDQNALYFLLTFLLVQSMALFSTVLFKRYVLVKGVILVMVIFFGALVSNSFLVKQIIKINPGKAINSTVTEIYYDAKENVVERRVNKDLIWPKIRAGMPFSTLEINNWVINKNINGVDYTAYAAVIINPYSNVFVLLFIMSIPFLWLISCFKLKEKQL